MTVNIHVDTPLFTMNKEDEVAEPKPRRRKRASAEVVTPDGTNAQQIIAAWVNVMTRKTGTRVPPSVTKRLARQVKSLISTGYETNQIKNGLTIWTVRWMEAPLLSPETLERLTWKLVMDTSPEGRQFQAELKTAVVRFAGHSTAVTGGTSRQEQRNIANTQGKQDWRARHAERKRREEGL